MACAGAFSLAVLGCSDYNVSGSSDDPNVLTARGLSSSSVLENSSSSLFGLSSSRMEPYSSSQMLSSSSSKRLSSSSRNPVLCKADYAGSCASGGSRGDLWTSIDVADGDPMNVNVGLYADSSWKNMASGEWFVETDSADGGESNILWPVELGDDSNAFSLVPVVKSCYTLCGTAVLEKGSLTYPPFVSIGFTLAKDSTGKSIPVDVSNWNGICFAYQSKTAFTLELDLGDSVNAHIDYALPFVTLPKSKGEARCLEWSRFKFPSWLSKIPEDWVDEPNVGERAAKQLVAVKFKIQAWPGEYDFEIEAIGTNLD
ncbi:hypothetical protein [Fibrobacter succinogenes]|uniref:hypothetical protein n=1 Tax=Fibrobacter succinogenes TaxID=833 RepID=UPI001568B528|nr:hypothetical protein [Fibrobacter succinogenes]